MGGNRDHIHSAFETNRADLAAVLVNYMKDDFSKLVQLIEQFLQIIVTPLRTRVQQFANLFAVGAAVAPVTDGSAIGSEISEDVSHAKEVVNIWMGKYDVL